MSKRILVLILVFISLLPRSMKSQCTYASSTSISAATFLACGTITINPSVTLTVTGAVTNNTAGLNITVVDNGYLVFNSGVTLNNTGNFGVTGTGSMSIAAGGLTINSSGSFSTAVTTTITGNVTDANSGGITVTAPLSITGNLTQNSSGTITDNSTISITGNYSIQNSGGITGTGTVTAGGTVSTTSSGTFFGSSSGCTGCTFSSAVPPATTYTFTGSGGKTYSGNTEYDWTVSTNWNPTVSGGPPSGSNVCLIPIGTNTISNVPTTSTYSLNNVTMITGTATPKFCWLSNSGSSSNVFKIASSLTVPASYTLGFGESGNRMCVTLVSGCTATINGWLGIDAGSTCRTLNVNSGATLIVGSSGLIYDPAPTTGDDFQALSGATLKIANAHGLPDVSSGTVVPVAATSSVAVWMDGAGGGGTCGTGNGAGFNFATGVNYEFNGVATQTVGLGMTMNNTTNPANITISNTSGPVNLSGNVTMTGNLVIAPSATLNTNGYSLTVSGTFSNSGVFNAGASSITLKGNMVNNGTFNAGTSTVSFGSGAAVPAQTCSGTVTPTFYNLTMNNSNGLTLTQDVSVSNALTLTSGLITTSAAGSGLLMMLSGSSAPALTAASTSYVNGYLQQQISTSANGSSTVNFPIGNATDCRPLTLTVSHKNTTTYYYTGKSFHASADALGYTYAATTDTVSNVHYWTLDRTDDAACTVSDPANNLNGNQQIKLYFGTTDFVYEGTNYLTIVKNVVSGGAQGTQWYDIGGTVLNAAGGAWVNSGAPQAGSVTSTSAPSTFTSFSTFSLGSKLTGWNSLPISLLNFSAILNDHKKVDLNWTTQTEVNNKYFTIERSADGQNFSALLDVPSKAPNGNSTMKLSYTTTDNEPLSGVSYYRLKQTDYNGKNKTFNTVSVSMSNTGIKFVVYPNPNSGEFKADFSGVENNHEVQVVLTDQNGKEVYSGTFYAQEANNTINIIPDNKIGKGVYFCSLIVEGVKHTVKVLVN